MPTRKVSYPALIQAELTTALVTYYTVTANRIALTFTIVFCNFSATDRGFDLKIRPVSESTANKHFLRGSSTAGQGKLQAGNTEIWEIVIRPGDTYIIEAEAEVDNAISMNLSAGEASMFNE